MGLREWPISPDKIASLNLSSCSGAILVDRASNDASFRRQAKLDNSKSKEQLRVEDFISTAALLSMCGLNAIVLNRWDTSLFANQRFIHSLFQNMLVEGISLAEAVAALDDENVKRRVAWNATCVGATYNIFT